MIRGYARVSTADQDLSAQFDALKAAGAVQVFQEKISGARADRPDLMRLLDALQPGDVLLVTRLDRLARSTMDLLNIIDRVGKIGATFKSLADTWADTTTPHGRLILTVLGGLAEFERELIKARTGEGIRRAREAGKKFGAPHALTGERLQEALDRIAAGATPGEVAKVLGVHRDTVKRLVAREAAQTGASNSGGTLHPG